MSDTDDLFEAVAKLARILPLDRQYELISRLAAQARLSAQEQTELRTPIGRSQPRIFLVEDESPARSRPGEVEFEAQKAEAAVYGRPSAHDPESGWERPGAVWSSLEHYDIPTVLRQKVDSSPRRRRSGVKGPPVSV